VPSIDTNRQFAGDARLTELVRYVEASVSVNETEWLEWKSSLDLGKNEALFAVAKGVLGFSNRDPGVAGQFAGGYAYFVVGAEAGSITGQASLDNDVLVKKITPFIGNELSWRPHWVRVDGKSVLIIEVDPPKWGDRSHTLQKQFQDAESGRNFLAGQVFVRRAGGTHPANPFEVRMLEDRMILRPWRVAVRQVGEPPARLSATEAAIGDYVEAERRRLIAPLEEEERRTNAATAPSSVLAAFGLTDQAFLSAVAGIKALQSQETRTPQQYRDELWAYLNEIEGSIRRVASARLAKDGLGDLQLILLNLVDDNLEAVRLELDLAGEFFVAGPVSRKACDLPPPPRIWGPYSPGLGYSGSGTPISFGATALAGISQTPTPHVARSGEATHVVLPPVSLRPMRPATVATLSIVGFGDDETLRVSWSATASNKSGECAGELEVRLGHAIGLDEALNRPSE
jgi:hypothetical protein